MCRSVCVCVCVQVGGGEGGHDKLTFVFSTTLLTILLLENQPNRPLLCVGAGADGCCASEGALTLMAELASNGVCIGPDTEAKHHVQPAELGK